MPKALIVEDNSSWQRELGIMAEGAAEGMDVTTVDNYDAAAALIDGSHALYTVDGEFPRSEGGPKEEMGIELVKAIGEREGDYGKIFMVSGNFGTLRKAQELGVEKIYNKGLADEDAGIRSAYDLGSDMKEFLT